MKKLYCYVDETGQDAKSEIFIVVAVVSDKDLLEKAIKKQAKDNYLARVYIDGIDRKKAGELTNALRVKGISLELVKGKRDESEPLIRLADMWAGCIRSALLGRDTEKQLVERAEREGYLQNLTK